MQLEKIKVAPTTPLNMKGLVSVLNQLPELSRDITEY